MNKFSISLILALFLSSLMAFGQNDPRFPDGFEKPESHRIPLSEKNNEFVVPEGKNFYITRLTTVAPTLMSASAVLAVNDNALMVFNRGSELCGASLDQYFVTPVILKGGDKIKLSGKGEVFLQAFTVPAKVEPVILKAGEEFDLPKGKTFVLMHTIRDSGCDIAYKGKFAFTEIDALHFPEFFSTDKEVDALDKEVIRLGYIY